MTELPTRDQEATSLWSTLVPMGNASASRGTSPARVSFFVSEESSFCSGAELVVDGARSVDYSTPADVKR